MKYRVYMIKSFIYGDGETDTLPQEFVGETTATSEKQAINNVRYRMFGAYNPAFEAMPGDGAMFVNFRAEPVMACPAVSIAELTDKLHRRTASKPQQLSFF